MTDTPKRTRTSLAFFALGVLAAIGGGLAGWYGRGSLFDRDPAAGMAKGDRAAIEQVVREYILTHPEILPEAMENLQRKETGKQLAGVRAAVETPFPGAILGNANGKVTLVEFTDFACGYCRKSVEDVDALIREYPDLRVVVRELPILSPASADAARMALAAAQQGKYAEFHRAMFAAGRPDAQTIAAAARVAGVDMAKAKQALADPRIEQELQRNLDLARQLGFNGTPSWVVGDAVLAGAIGKDALAEAIDAARP